ncbi:MAG: 2-oxo acid dehydrogenase subunit E2 [Spirochaetaceae bacterium]|jgi:pyruvate dehydrogenase E2 component (dihydrolipoamide acetyltransferase)|nr:2-oxo acid dehydrogenase subunit E2 [Spirochaetaceae bacterium]
MAHILIMPRQGNTVESCIIGSWRVKEGDPVTAETTVCDVETDKAAFEVPAGAAGIVLKILHAAGDDVPVLQPIAVIGQAGEAYAEALATAGGGEASPLAPPTSGSATPLSGGQPPATPPVPDAALPQSGFASPRARGLAAREAVSLAGLAGSGPEGRVIERDVRAALAGRPPLTQAAKAVADSGAVPEIGTGLGGRVTTADLGGTAPVPHVAQTVVTDLGEGAITETPIKGIRKVIADRMMKSLAESAQLTLNGQTSAVRMRELRARMKAAGEDVGLGAVTVNDLILFAVSRVLPLYPFMNAHKSGETIRTFERVHLGVAVDTPRGLLVPVIRNANLLSLRQISAEAKRLAKAAQDGTAKPDELSGSTFTVTNLGSLGITSFTPILNVPEVAILGVNAIEPRPVETADGGYTFEPHIGFSLTINHQVVDGAPGARFLKTLCEAVRDIDLWLAR